MTSGQIFAQNGPRGFFVADGIVGGDELPFGGAAPKAIVAASGVKSRSKRDATRDESRRELVPKKMRERVDWVAGAILIPTALVESLVLVLEGVGRLVSLARVIAR